MAIGCEIPVPIMNDFLTADSIMNGVQFEFSGKNIAKNKQTNKTR